MAYNKLVALVVQTKLDELFKSSYHFSMSTLRDAIRATGKDVIPPQDMRALETMHCTGWGQMTPELRNELQRKIYMHFAPYLPPALETKWADRKADAEDAEIRKEQPSTWGRIRNLLGYSSEG